MPRNRNIVGEFLENFSHQATKATGKIVAAMEGASNRLIDVEDLSEPEIDALRKYYKRLIELARKDDNLTTTHSIEEAATRHGTKYKKATDSTDKKSDRR